MEKALQQLESAIISAETAVGIVADSVSSEPLSVVAYDGFLSGSLAKFNEAAGKLGGDISKVGQQAVDCFTAGRALIVAAAACKKPTDEQLLKAFEPQRTLMDSIKKAVDKREKSFNHTKSVAELIDIVQWVLVSPAPVPFVKSGLDAVGFYVNKVLTSNKNADNKQDHRDFVKHLKATVSELADYVTKFHKMGLSWKIKGKDFGSFKPGSGKDEEKKAPSSPEDKILAYAERVMLIGMKLGGDVDEKAGPEDHPSVKDFDVFVNDFVTPFVNSAKKLGGDAEQLGTMFNEAFVEVRRILVAARQCKKPSDEDYAAGAAKLIAVVQKGCSCAKRGSPFEFHQQAFQEFIQCAQWVLVYPAPMPFVKSTLESSSFYLNKVLTSNKNADNKQDHRDFVKAIKTLVPALAAYVKKYHMTGVSWNLKGEKKFKDLMG